MQTFTKQPADVLDYDVDLTQWFKSTPGDRIQSVAVSVSSAGEQQPTLELGPGNHPVSVLMGDSAVRFKVWIGGGTDFEEYVVTCLATTLQDRVKEIEFKVKVRDV